MSNMKFLPYAQQSINQEDVEAVKNALLQPVITRGERVELFEKEMAEYCGAKFAIAFNSGTAALIAAYAAADTTPHDVIVTTPNTFVSTVGAAVQLGCVPVFVDIDRKTGNMNVEQAVLNINRPNSKGKTIIAPVHFAGIPVDMEEIDRAIADYKTIVIEDAAHAIGSCYKDGSKVGSCKYSQMTIFSFHPAKTLTTGEGGMVTTNDEELCRRLKNYRNNGMERDPKYWVNQGRLGYYEVNELSGNYNFTEMQAALGLSQLKRLDSFINKRQKLVNHYRRALQGSENVKFLEQENGSTVAWHLCVVQVNFSAFKKTKTEVMEALKSVGIGTQIHYIPVYKHPYFAKQMGDLSEYFPENEKYYAEALSLPLYYDLEESDVDRVALALKNILKK